MTSDTSSGRERIRALCLLSGGLDSLLAVCVLREQGIDVHAVAFDSPFFEIDKARAGAAQLGVPLHVVDFSADIIALLKDPPHGFGNCMNPCIDCHARMLRRAGELMTELGFQFLATGEVLNERPMSQNRQSLEVVARDSGYRELVLRPLSATLLPPTKPEAQGWVDRSRLLGIEGRGRKPQLGLADRYGLQQIPQPAGGCRLTEPGFCRRLKDLKDHEGLDGKRSLVMLRYGRHFRLGPSIKLIVGRNERDNVFLEATAELYDLVIRLEDAHGPTGLLPFTARDEHVLAGAAICARYGDVPSDQPVAMRVRSARGVRRLLATPADPATVERFMI